MSYNEFMATNAVVRSRIDAEVRDRAAEVLGGMGLTVSDAIRIVLTRVANENELPFDLKPNKLTRQTMRKTAKGREVRRAKNAADLFRKLGI
jgi:DNA-damage-inducible protein J